MGQKICHLRTKLIKIDDTKWDTGTKLYGSIPTKLFIYINNKADLSRKHFPFMSIYLVNYIKIFFLLIG